MKIIKFHPPPGYRPEFLFTFQDVKDVIYLKSKQAHKPKNVIKTLLYKRFYCIKGSDLTRFKPTCIVDHTNTWKIVESYDVKKDQEIRKQPPHCKSGGM